MLYNLPALQHKHGGITPVYFYLIFSRDKFFYKFILTFSI